jgi:hypothetical protein
VTARKSTRRHLNVAGSYGAIAERTVAAYDFDASGLPDGSYCTVRSRGMVPLEVYVCSSAELR